MSINNLLNSFNENNYRSIIEETRQLFTEPTFFPTATDVKDNNERVLISYLTKLDNNNTNLLKKFLSTLHSVDINDVKDDIPQELNNVTHEKYIYIENELPKFIKTCDDQHCFKKIESVKKKFKTTSSGQIHHNDISCDLEVKKRGKGKRKPENYNMKFTYHNNDNTISISWKSNKTSEDKSKKTKYIHYDELTQVEEKEEKHFDDQLFFFNNDTITLNQEKWYEPNGENINRNIVLTIIKDSSKFQEFFDNIKKTLLEKEKKKIIAADVIRSTMISDKNSFVNDVNDFLEFIKNNGGIVGKINNTFEKAKKHNEFYIPYFFYGLNITFFVKQTEEQPLQTKDKYIAFEVQFHTENTFQLKTEQHDDYDLQKSFDEILKSENENFTGNDKEFFVMCKQNYDDFMSLYNTDNSKKSKINNLFTNKIDVNNEDELVFIQNFIHDKLVLNKDILYELKNKDDIFHEKNNKFIDILVDQDTMEHTFVDQFSLMKQLFILCRCIKNYKLIYLEKNKGLQNQTDNEETLNTDIVKKYNCYNYYESKLLSLEKKYKNPTFDVSRRKKYEDFFITKTNMSQSIVINPLDELMQGSYIKKINSYFLLFLCKFLGISHKRKNKEENIKLITEEFKRVMKNDIGLPPFC
jgi:hypothetical protein